MPVKSQGGQARCHRILVDITKQSKKVSFIIYRFTFEAILKEMPKSHIFIIVVMCICSCYAVNYRGQFLFCLSYKKMYMICHKTIGIEMTTLWKSFPYLVNWINHVSQDSQKAEIVFTIFKNVLPICASHHDVIDARSAYFS